MKIPTPVEFRAAQRKSLVVKAAGVQRRIASYLDAGVCPVTVYLDREDRVCRDVVEEWLTQYGWRLDEAVSTDQRDGESAVWTISPLKEPT